VLKDLLRTTDLSARDVTDLVDLAAGFGGRTSGTSARLAGQLVVLYLTEPAPETVRISAAAAALLGAGVTVLGPDEYQQGVGASVAGVARAVSLCAAVVVAVTDDVELRRLADAASVPVLDGRLGAGRPCAQLAAVLERRSHCAVLDRPRVVEVTPADIVDLAHRPGAATSPSSAAGGSGGSAGVLTAIDRRIHRTAALVAPPPPCTCPVHGNEDRPRIHTVAALLLALHRRQLTGARPASR
jgi:hypothetical protein